MSTPFFAWDLFLTKQGDLGPSANKEKCSPPAFVQVTHPLIEVK